MNRPLTPYVQIDEGKALANIHKFQSYCDAHGIRLRPHIKTHKTLELARAQMEAGAVGITCQKVTEAEVFVEAGFKDILITYNLLGAERTSRLAKLREKANISVVADHPKVVDGLAEASQAQNPLSVLIEVDTGSKRCGLSDPSDIVALAHHIQSKDSLQFTGLMTYPKKGQPQKADALLAQLKQALNAAGLPCPIISSGGSPDMWRAHESQSATEYRVGTYVYFDRSLIQAGACELEDCALVVKATVISTQGDRFMLDAGSKALTSDLQGCQGHGLILEYPQAVIYGLSEEHGHVDASSCAQRPNIGDIVTVLPNHACPVSNLFDQIWVMHPDGTGSLRPVHARGRVG